MDGDAGPPAIRASDAEREVTMQRLQAAAGEGRLSFEELADRIEAAGTAMTRDELERLTRDLPAEPRGQEMATIPTRVSAVFGDVRRTGGWTVPARGKWQSLFGDVVLDLRAAHVAQSVVEIDAGTVFGDVDLLVPEGVEVEIRARVLFGDVKQEAGEAAPPGAPRIVLTGGTVFGDVRVRSRRLRERLAERLRSSPVAGRFT